MKKERIEDLRQFVTEHQFPTDILVEVITKCNLNCIMCPHDQMTREQGRMSMQLWRKIIDEVAEVSPDTRIWPAVMGEPLLRGGEIFEMVRYASDKGVEVHLNTNMKAFEPEMLDPLFDSGLVELLIGLDGASPKVYETVRRTGNYSRVIENIHLILDEKERRGLDKPRLTLQFIVMEENAHEQEAFVQYWQGTGKKVRLKLKPRTGWVGAVSPWFNGDDPLSAARDIPCTWLLRQMTVFWNGHIPQCDGDWDGGTFMGDVNRQSLLEIWQGPLKLLRERHLRLDFKDLPCENCLDWQAGRSRWVQCGDEESSDS